MNERELSTNQGAGENKGPEMLVYNVCPPGLWLKCILLTQHALEIQITARPRLFKPSPSRMVPRQDKRAGHVRALWIRSSLPCLDF